jgi:hypothetical protein
MTRSSLVRWAVRLSWPLIGGVWGAQLGFGGYLHLPHNADSFGTVLALGFFSVFAWVGLFAGIASGALIGGLTEKLLRRLGVGLTGSLCLATVLTVWVLWQITGLVQSTFPGLRAPAATPPASATTRPPSANPCAHPPPLDSRERKSWESECR